nr:glycosyltransferase [Novosphingopyxis iocasae]
MESGNQVHAMTMNDAAPIPNGVTATRSISRHGSDSKDSWARDMEAKVIRAHVTLESAVGLRQEGYVPDVIVGHPGWGDTLFLKNVWPEARFGIYCEFFYEAQGTDINFDPEFKSAGDPIIADCRAKLKALTQRLHFPMANAGISPTNFQADTYPDEFRDRITVIHDGIDTRNIRPRPDAGIQLGSGKRLTRQDEVITFVARNLEPYRGYHIFMRALPKLMRERPNARVIIVGGNGVSYGAAPPEGSWRERFLGEVVGELDMSRVHFVGNIPYDVFTQLMAVSKVHVYLTYPFVLSWSLLEAMASGTAVVASDTAPLQEVISHGETGLLFPFFDPDGLAAQVCSLLEDEPRRASMAAKAREHVIANYDLTTVSLPRQMEWLQSLYEAEPLPPF